MALASGLCQRLLISSMASVTMSAARRCMRSSKDSAAPAATGLTPV